MDKFRASLKAIIQCGLYNHTIVMTKPDLSKELPVYDEYFIDEVADIGHSEKVVVFSIAQEPCKHKLTVGDVYKVLSEHPDFNVKFTRSYVNDEGKLTYESFTTDGTMDDIDNTIAIFSLLED